MADFWFKFDVDKYQKELEEYFRKKEIEDAYDRQRRARLGDSHQEESRGVVHEVRQEQRAECTAGSLSGTEQS